MQMDQNIFKFQLRWYFYLVCSCDERNSELLPSLHVFPSLLKAIPVGHAHWYPPGLARQRWLQSPLLLPHGSGPDIERTKTIMIEFSTYIN